MTVRARLRSHLQTSGVLDLPRFSRSGADLVDVSLERASYDPRDFPLVHVALQTDSVVQDTSDLSRQLRTCFLIITAYVAAYDNSWRAPRSYYDSDYPKSRSYQTYTSIDKNDLRNDLEEIIQEMGYRIRREDLTQLDGVVAVYDTSATYRITDESTQTYGAAELTLEVRYRQ